MHKWVVLTLAVLLLCLSACAVTPNAVRNEAVDSMQSDDFRAAEEHNPFSIADSAVYADCQGTDEPYSTLSLKKSDGGYAVELSLYRVGFFGGTATQAEGALLFACDRGVSGRIEFDRDCARFEVTESECGSVYVGEAWTFQKTDAVGNP